MSNINTVSIRLRGKLTPLDELTRVLGVTPTSFRLGGMPLTRGGTLLRPTDVWVRDLAEWEGEHAGDDVIIVQVANELQRLAPALAALDRGHLRAELYIGITQSGDWGGCELPSDLVVAAAAGRLDLVVSVLAYQDDDNPSDELESTEEQSRKEETPRRTLH